MTAIQPHHAAWLAANPHRSAEWLAKRFLDGFDVHHVDGDHGNNDPTNLVLVEHGDHMLLHNGKARTLGRMKPQKARSKKLRAPEAPPMSTAEFRAILSALGVKQAWVSRQLGVSVNQVSRWAVGAIPIPGYAQAYLRLASGIVALVRGMEL